MDKETLSNYGWIVICVMVLAVLLALASPFGTFVAGAIKSTTQGLFDVNQSALNSTGLISIEGQEFDKCEHDYEVTTTANCTTAGTTTYAFILLALGLLCCILALFAGSGLLIIGGYIIFCSILCLVLKRYAGLVIGWITMIQAIILTPSFTGVRMLSVFNPGYIRHAGINQIISILMWVFLAVLIIRTAVVITKSHK